MAKDHRTLHPYAHMGWPSWLKLPQTFHLFTFFSFSKSLPDLLATNTHTHFKWTNRPTHVFEHTIQKLGTNCSIEQIDQPMSFNTQHINWVHDMPLTYTPIHQRFGTSTLSLHPYTHMGWPSWLKLPQTFHLFTFFSFSKRLHNLLARNH